MEQTEEREEKKKGRLLDSALLRLVLPLDSYVLKEARRLSALKGVRVEELNTCVSQDPVLVIEFLKAANAICLSEGKPTLFNLARAIDRLGSQSIIRLLTEISSRPYFELDEVNHWFEVHRSKCKRTAIIARMYSEVLIKGLSDDCQLSGLFYFFGDLVTVAHLKEQYVSLAEEFQRGALNYRIVQRFKFEPMEVGLLYLRKFGIPEILLAPIDKASQLKGDRGIMRTIISAAAEMVDAFDANKWEKLSPGVTLPSQSSIRLLVMSKPQYLKLYERATEYLNEIKRFEERDKTPQGGDGMSEIDKNAASISFSPQEDSLQGEIQNLLLGIMTEPEEDEDSEDETSMEELQRDFSLELDQQAKAARSSEGPKKIAPPKLQTNRANRFLTGVSEMFEGVNSSEELLTELLEKLTFEGHFEKAAIVALSNDRRSAIVVAARGISLRNGHKMHIEDPLSPLAQGFSKVQSFGNVSNENSPFGSKAFAVAPLNANHHNPVALYADCGNDGSLTFEARRVFRTVVEMANQKLIQLPGGIPVELEENY